jgi:polysaccharide biosynthesis transport protein
MNAFNLRGELALPNSAVLPLAAETANRMSFVREYLRIVRRWRYVILGVALACVIVGLVVTLLMTPQYTAVSTIEISRESSKVTEIKGIERDAGVADQEFYQTQYGLLRSRSLADRVTNQLRLADDPAFFNRYGFRSSLPALVKVGGRYSAAGRGDRVVAAREILLKYVQIDPTRLSRLVDIGFTGSDASFAATVANAWATNFIKANLERKIDATAYGRDLLERQLALQKARLDDSQRQLVAYASSQQIINLPSQGGKDASGSERSIVSDDLAAFNVALAQATNDRIQTEARYRQAERAGASTEALRNQAINSLRQRRAELSADYNKLMTQFEPGYPAAQAVKSQIDQLDRSIEREESRVSDSLRADYREAAKREQVLLAKVGDLKSSYLDLRRRSIQYNIFQQEVDTNRALYDGLLQRYKEVGIAGGVGVNNVAIVDSADVPKKPSSPRILLNLAAALVIGLILGGLTAIVFEQIDEAIADPAEIERRLGLPLLGSVPKAEGDTDIEHLLDRKSSLFDAYLTVQTNLAFTTAHGVPRSFAITSTRPAEGKSTTAVALSTTLARAQRKVILVDGDMRSPSVHVFAGVDHERGLSNFLSGQDDIASLIFPMRDFGFAAISAGPIPPNAAELLTGDRLSLLVSRLLKTYDHVVIDAPPVMGLADAPLIASKVEGVIYVVESHGIRSTTVKTALNRLASTSAHILGGVLTKFEAKKGSASYGYAYDYGYGYGTADKPNAKAASSK